MQTGRLTRNPATELTGILKTRISNHRQSLPREELPGLLQALEDYGARGRLLTQLAIQLLALTFVRSGELRGARWEEFDLGDRLWRIPASRMKMRSDRLVPLSLQAVAAIAQVQPINSRFALVFPSERNRQEPLSDNTMRSSSWEIPLPSSTSFMP